ncbi:hypothetical protein KEM48_002707 [Puccinia striiformis f. sp. tritici PST-130]|nr:hypothetical protein KEM48_002707 [Puccinia striiformis f. sp. tritici PST-130]
MAITQSATSECSNEGNHVQSVEGCPPLSAKRLKRLESLQKPPPDVHDDERAIAEIVEAELDWAENEPELLSAFGATSGGAELHTFEDRHRALTRSLQEQSNHGLPGGAFPTGPNPHAAFPEPNYFYGVPDTSRDEYLAKLLVQEELNRGLPGRAFASGNPNAALPEPRYDLYAVPDTSRDEELARRIQRELDEQQSLPHSSSQLRQQWHPQPAPHWHQFPGHSVPIQHYSGMPAYPEQHYWPGPGHSYGDPNQRHVGMPSYAGGYESMSGSGPWQPAQMGASHYMSPAPLAKSPSASSFISRKHAPSGKSPEAHRFIRLSQPAQTTDRSGTGSLDVNLTPAGNVDHRVYFICILLVRVSHQTFDRAEQIIANAPHPCFDGSV